MRRKNLKSIIAQCQDNRNFNIYKSINKHLDNMQDDIQNESSEKINLINLYFDQAKSSVTDKMMSIDEIKVEQNIHFKNDFENFLTPQAIKEAKYQDKDKILSIMRHSGKKVMWKPTRLKLSKDIQDGIDRLMSNTAE